MIPEFSSKKEAALFYASMNLKILPTHNVIQGRCSCGFVDCTKQGKHPIIFTGKNHEIATNDQEKITEWWEKYPHANIAVTIGPTSGLLVLDVDAQKGGLASFTALEKELGELPETLKCNTGGGGFHLYFQNDGTLQTRINLLAGIDLLASEGRYVLVPPSDHISGRQYTWAYNTEVIAKLPASWTSYLQRTEERKLGQSSPIDQVVSFGTRNSTLTSLAGTLRRRGLNEDTIFSMLSAFNNECCQPPVTDNELKTIVKSVCKYAPVYNVVTTDLSLNFVPEKPPVLPESFLTGFIGDFINWAKQGTDAPYEFLFGAALSTLAAVTGHRHYYMRFGTDYLHTNLWLLLIAGSGLLRKSTSINLARDLLLTACDDRLLPNRLTSETLYELLQTKPAGIFLLSEFGAFLGNAGKNYMQGFKEDLTELYDAPKKFARGRKDPKTGQPIHFKVASPTISILSASTINWFNDNIRESDSAGGFLPRFLYVCATQRTREIMSIRPPLDATPPEFIAALTALLNIKGEVFLLEGTESAFIYDAFHKEIQYDAERTEDNKDVLGSYATRLQTYALKFALILEALSAVSLGATDVKEISPKNMSLACAMAAWFYQHTKWLLRNELCFKEHDKNTKRVLKILRENGGRIPHSKLLKAVDVDVTIFKRVMDTLISTEEVGYCKEPPASGKGRPGEYYWLKSRESQ